MKYFSGTDEHLVNALDHMADNRPITQTEKSVCKEAANRLRVLLEADQAAQEGAD
tara:strand:- start:640 stop:804 length:165 start_codon:yes stop_codon:yes gene_type:complete